jgi:hypothetical protein
MLLGLNLGLAAGAQTAKSAGETPAATFYDKGEMVFELAPTVSSASLLNPKIQKTYGCSLETEYWETTWTGTGLEAGSYDSTVLTYGIVDHTAVLQDFRIAPFPGYFSRLALGVKSGAETYFKDGSKDVEIGGELYWTFSNSPTSLWHNLRLEVDVVQHERTNSALDGQTGRISFQYRF